ncbi:Transcriptional regulator LytR [Streptomyces sp. RB5]|uniref:Transcriptional regulator LytR n=1 Tax=Streptomyces smaragdinus TaxID=2585196 RepID=A0A7K0CLZ3_9ACTN|nr:LCP family protein [Streptomyces smaragdinus]MQY13794.1 Transcriptional regulator LytR [Streptomyces smaragdinus]
MRRLVVTALLLAALATGGAVRAVDAPAGPSGTNILVAGIDRRAGLPRETIDRLHVGGEGCDCTDVLMLVHLSADGHRASVVSLLRDSYVAFPPHGQHKAHSGKINAAFKEGGDEFAVRTVEQATGLKVDHYLRAGFEDFAQTVDRLGGATVCTAEPVEDVNSGLALAPGTHHVDGRVALRYARARHIPPPGDGGRVRRQQKLVAGMLDRLREAGAFTDLEAATFTASALLTSVHAGGGTSLVDLARLGMALGKVRDTEFATVPVSDWDHRVPTWGSTVVWDRKRAGAMWEALREDRPLTGDERITPAGRTAVDMPTEFIRVRTSDADVAKRLKASGFDAVVEPVAAGATGQTVVTYDPEWIRYAPTLAAALPGARLEPVAGHGKTFDIALGTDGQKVLPVVFDRTSVEGAPVSGKSLLCD